VVAAERRVTFGGERARSIHLEPWLNGRVHELWDEGESFETGKMIECDPPRRIVFTWRDAEDLWYPLHDGDCQGQPGRHGRPTDRAGD
jgi:uncharacterized protein YndB with AHSA1/START domain